VIRIYSFGRQWLRLKKEFKKSLWGKRLIKSFSNAMVVLVTTIPALKAQLGMIDYTFLLSSKNDISSPTSAGTEIQ